jgi:hypothetical protein
MTKWVIKSFTEKEGAMKKLVITIVVMVGLLLVASVFHADMTQLEAYYNECITKKIVNCQRIASMENHNNPCFNRLVKMRCCQAKFYRKHREELVREMIARNIGKKPHKIDYFLITKFKEWPLA